MRVSDAGWKRAHPKRRRSNPRIQTLILNGETGPEAAGRATGFSSPFPKIRDVRVSDAGWKRAHSNRRRFRDVGLGVPSSPSGHTTSVARTRVSREEEEGSTSHVQKSLVSWERVNKPVALPIAAGPVSPFEIRVYRGASLIRNAHLPRTIIGP